MRAKLYKMRGLSVENGADTFIDMDLEFEGRRAYIVLDTVPVGDFQLKARLEIDPKFLQRVDRKNCDFIYCGKLVLPRPQDN